MAFQEKSAWIMTLALLFGGGFYYRVVASMSAGGELAPPNIGLIGVYTVILVIVAVVGHILVAVLAPKDADAPLDERERKIFDRAGHLSGYIFGFGVVFSLGLYLFSYNGNLLFYGVFASLMVSQLAEYVFQIFLFRRGF